MQMQDSLSRVYGALAHPVRRAILAQLAHGEAKVGDFDMTAPAITNHLKVLEEAGLVNRRVAAQTRILSLEPSALREGEEWIGNMRRFWTEAFARLETHLATAGKAKPKKSRDRR